MKNDVVRRFTSDAASISFTINEKRDFNLGSFKFLTDGEGKAKKAVTVTAKYDGVATSYETTFEYYTSYTFEGLSEVSFTKDSTITVAITQTGTPETVKMYAEVAYIDSIVDYVLDEAAEALTITTV